MERQLRQQALAIFRAALKAADPAAAVLRHVRLRDSGRSSEQFQLRVGQGEVEYGRIVAQLARFHYERALSVDIRDIPDAPFAMEPEVRKLRVLIGNYRRSGSQVLPRDAHWLTDTVSLLQTRWPRAGVSVYLLSRLDAAQIQALRAGPFREPAVPYAP